MSTVRVTLTLDETLLTKAREVSGGNFSRFVSSLLEERVEAIRRQKLREDLIAGCQEDAELDLEICHEWRYVDAEMVPEEDF